MSFFLLFIRMWLAVQYLSTKYFALHMKNSNTTTPSPEHRGPTGARSSASDNRLEGFVGRLLLTHGPGCERCFRLNHLSLAYFFNSVELMSYFVSAERRPNETTLDRHGFVYPLRSYSIKISKTLLIPCGLREDDLTDGLTFLA